MNLLHKVRHHVFETQCIAFSNWRAHYYTVMSWRFEEVSKVGRQPSDSS